MTRIWTGTASVTNGSATVALAGDPLTGANCPADAPISLGRASYYVGSLTDNAHLVLTADYEGETGTVSAEIDPLNPNAISLVQLTKQIAEYNARRVLLDARGLGLFYTMISMTGASDPGPGNVAPDAGSWAATTALYIDVLDASDSHVDQSAKVALWTPGTLLFVEEIASGAFAAFILTEAPTDQGGWYRLGNLDYRGGDGPAYGEDIRLIFVLAGQPGTGIHFDQVGDFADRDDYDAEAKNFGFLSEDGDGDTITTPVVFVKRSATSGDWAGPFRIQGNVGPAGTGDRFDLSLFIRSKPRTGEMSLRHVFSDTGITFPAGLTTSSSSADVASSGTVVFSIKKNGTEFATLTFMGSDEGAFSAAFDTSFVKDDVLTIFAPSPRDASLSDVSITLAGTRT